MPLSIGSPKDFWMGVFYAVIGAAALLISQDYAFGTTARMGPGFFPVIVAVLLVAVGAISILRSLRSKGEPLEPLKLLPVLLVFGAILAFGLLVETAGYLVAGIVLLLLAGAASQYARLNARTLLGAVAFIVITALVFIKGLGVAMPMIGAWQNFF